MGLYLGIDTSCYTTSLAVMDGGGSLLCEERKVLSVPQGGRGLAQNEAVFQHINNLPVLIERVLTAAPSGVLLGVTASTRPRPAAGSYMPVFKVAESYGRSIASMLKIPFVETSHQEGHLAAGIWSAGGPGGQEFLAAHISGGTTEILRVANAGEGQFDISILGGTADLHAGQFVDRVGVRLGLPFPAGPHLEDLAGESRAEISIPSSARDYTVSFSGPEAAAMRLAEQGAKPADIARAVEKCVANTLEKVIRKAVLETGLKDVLIVGGVSANRYIRERLPARLGHSAIGAKLFFASGALSSDNAVGVALVGMKKLSRY
ncbi:MAG: O-sialoglycoprotein endopeptidase [Firmicutes bacterium HGW-Firmicutes-14]|nr:MAG: O-sialoglycoprotein endopeptidase [Firmicutes bacterium HGW-Firmicutes-14]